MGRSSGLCRDRAQRMPTNAAIASAVNPCWPAARAAPATTFGDVSRSLTSRPNRLRLAALIEIRSIFLIGADSRASVDLRFVSQ
jgi:hypothetical protein